MQKDVARKEAKLMQRGTERSERKRTNCIFRFRHPSIVYLRSFLDRLLETAAARFVTPFLTPVKAGGRDFTCDSGVSELNRLDGHRASHRRRVLPLGRLTLQQLAAAGPPAGASFL